MEEAVYGDCYILISNFIQNENPSFANFCTEWKKLCFQHIFTAQTTYIELQQTVVATYHIGKRLMCNRKPTKEISDEFNDFDVTNEESKILIRIGGLYLLYAVYFKQPLERYTKIEVSLETWRQMKQFVRVTLSENSADYDEARFIFWKLYQSQAFRFTALDYCIGLENLVDYEDLEKSATNSASKGYVDIGRVIEKLSSFAEVKQTTPALVALEEGYNQMKKSLSQIHKLDGQLLPPINIFQNIQNSFENIEKILKNNESETSSNTKQKSSRRSLKDKAFASGKPSTSTKTDDNEQPKKQQKRMSSRTIFAEQLPKDFIKDLKQEDYEIVNEIDAESAETAGVQSSLDDIIKSSESHDETAEEDSRNTERVDSVCKLLLDDL